MFLTLDLPIVYIPLALADLANGERNLSSKARLRAIQAIELATFCILTGSRSPCRQQSSETNSWSGTLSNTPSVATSITSPSSTGKLDVSAASGLEINIDYITLSVIMNKSVTLYELMNYYLVLKPNHLHY